MVKRIGFLDVTQDGLFVWKKNNVWTLPVFCRKGENVFDCFYNGFKEQLGISPKSISIYNPHGKIELITKNYNGILKVNTYFGHLEGKFKLSKEISDYDRMNKKNHYKDGLSFLTYSVLNSLIQEKFLEDGRNINWKI